MLTHVNDAMTDDAYISILEKDFECARKDIGPARDAHLEAENIHDAATYLVGLLSKGRFESEANVVTYLIENFAGVRKARAKKFIAERDVLNEWHSELVEARRKRAASKSEVASAND